MEKRQDRSKAAATDRYTPKRGVIVIVDSEAEQQATFERLKGLGFARLRVVTA